MFKQFQNTNTTDLSYIDMKSTVLFSVLNLAVYILNTLTSFKNTYKILGLFNFIQDSSNENLFCKAARGKA